MGESAINWPHPSEKGIQLEDSSERLLMALLGNRRRVCSRKAGCVKNANRTDLDELSLQVRAHLPRIDGVGGLARPKVAQTSDTSAFLHNQDP
jgi:hypothetical protein